MPLLTISLAASPILVCGFAILVLRRSAIVGAAAGIFLATVLSAFWSQFSIDVPGLRIILGTTGILILSAFLVVVPGLYLNAVLRGQGVIDGLVAWIESVRLDPEAKAFLLLLGVLPAVESLTGFGVSLFLGIPIFFRLFSPERAYRMSLVSMNIMPWGTLALATVVGASLSGYSITDLGTATALTSFLVYPTVGIIAVFVLGGGPLLRKYAIVAVLLGIGLSASLYFFNKSGFVETAGVFSGLLVGFVGFLGFRVFLRRTVVAGKAYRSEATSPVRVFFPYVLLVSLLCVTRIIPGLHQWLADLLILTSGRVKFSVFTSPGLALATAGVIVFLLKRVKIDHVGIWKRSRTALLSLGGFILLAQIMNQSNMITTIAGALKQLKNHDEVLVLSSAMLGMVSGFITGSNLGGNALTIGMQQQVGSVLNEGLLFSALQNSSAGAAVFISLPIIILVRTIAQDALGEKKDVPKSAEYDLLQFALCAGVFIYIALFASFAIARHVLSLP